MKKFYAMMVAALVCAGAFAADPSASDLAKYQKADHYVACFSTPADATCNDIVWVGTYNAWNLQDEDIIVCEKLTGFDGWYVAVVPVGAYKDGDATKEFDVNGECSGKPVQVNECGKRNWDYQCGNKAAITLVSGAVTIDDKGDEADLKDWSKTEPTIIKMTAWKKGINPCSATCSTFALTVRVYAPYCEYNETLEPTLKGSWDWDAKPITMDFKGTYFEGVIPEATENIQFKFNNDAAGTWGNQFEYFTPEDTENDVPAKWSTFENFNLDPNDAQAKYFKREGNVLTFDFSDTEKYRYQSCVEQVEKDSTVYKVVIWLAAPANAPEAGIEVMGDFIADGWKNGVVLTHLDAGGYVTPDIQAMEFNVFKFREAGTWDNEIVYVGKADKDGKPVGLEDIKFSDVWKDGDYKGEKVKEIELDYSDAAKYVWKTDWVAPEEGIENIVLTEKAQKVVVDGVIYIVRDNKMFNLQGVQVR